ncbi:MAG: zf-TFIIB domain-containing protein [Gemmatimonadaceae bacterium]
MTRSLILSPAPSVMDAKALTCPQCGAVAAVDAAACTFCHARLATVACSACFGLVFIGSKHCGHCGVKITSPDRVSESPLSCPRGCGALRAIRLGSVELEECEGCGGMWLRQGVFQRLYADEERGSIVLGPELSAHQVQRGTAETVRYVPCPECARLMNRINFAKRSGIILDSCAKHGTWFDADELRRVVEFIREGGLDQLRAHERMHLAEERRLLDLKQRLSDHSLQSTTGHDEAGSQLRTTALECMLFLFGGR